MSADPAPAGPLLQTRALRAGFGVHAVLHGVDLSVAHGGVTGIFGLNGAGKSVLMKVIAGLVPAWSGQVRLGDREVTALSVEQRVAAGLGHVPQGRQVFRELSVEQNLRVGGYCLRRRDRRRFTELLDRAYTDFPVLAKRRTQLAGTLSGGQQASLAVARALLSDPALLLIDEPTAGLSVAVCEELLTVLRQVRDRGMTILLVEQNVAFGLRIADEAVVLQRGTVVFAGPVAGIDTEALAGYLGIGRLLRAEVAQAGESRSGGVPAPPPAPRRRRAGASGG